MAEESSPSGCPGCPMDRRQFVLLAAAAASAAGCASFSEPSAHSAGGPSKVVNAGPASQYAAAGVYDKFREQGFFLVRQSSRLLAISSLCTHRNCKLDAEPDHSFSCPCHGSTFDANGKVTEGPATVNLPMLPLVEVAGQVHVTVTS